jgi:hypothetical protein
MGGGEHDQSSRIELDLVPLDLRLNVLGKNQNLALREPTFA